MTECYKTLRSLQKLLVDLLISCLNESSDYIVCVQEMSGKSLPQVGQKNGKEMLELLQGISGAFRPAILTCLMVSPLLCNISGLGCLDMPRTLQAHRVKDRCACKQCQGLDEHGHVLQGVSGAGKTTLMDVLAGRKTGAAYSGRSSIAHLCASCVCISC